MISLKNREKAYDLIKDEVSIVGFRRGHAPVSLYMKEYGVKELDEIGWESCL